jgi:hypothetical protein
MTYPLLIVTGIEGAWGKMKRTPTPAGKLSWGTIGAKSLPSAPRPCNQITEAVTDRPLGHSSSTAGRYDMVGSHLIEIRALHKWLESMNLEDLLMRKNTSNGRETHKVTNDWKERYSRQPFAT